MCKSFLALFVIVGTSLLKSKHRHIFAGIGFILVSSSPAMAITGITYTGRILDSRDVPISASEVYFTATIYDHQSRCALYSEQRQLDLSKSSGMFSFDIGSNDPTLVAGSAGFNNGITSLSQVFNNDQTFTALNGCVSGPNTYTPAPDSPRILGIIFKVGPTGSPEALPALKINPVPTALQAFEVNGYGTGSLLKVNPSVDKTTDANEALNQDQYDEFWRLVKNPLAAYLPSTGDVTLVSGNNKVTMLLGQPLPLGPASSNQVLVSNGTSWTLQPMNTGSVTSVTGNAPITVSGTASAPVVSINQATSSTDGYLSSSDWNTFNSKQSSSLADGKIWIGNSSGTAEARILSGDATVTNTGVLVLATTISSGTKGSANKVPQITYDSKGRLTTVNEITVDDTTKLPLAGGTMSGAINMGGQDIVNTGNISMAANNYLTLSSSSTNGTSAGQMWYDSGNIKYYDGSSVKTLNVSGSGIATLNGLSSVSQNFAIGTAGNAPAFSSSVSTHTLNIPLASASSAVTAGLLSNAEYAVLNAKQASSLASANIWVGNASGGAQARAVSGDISIDNAGSTSLVAIKGKAVDATPANTMGQILFYDSVADKWKTSAASAPSNGQVLKWNDTSKIWEPGSDTVGWTAVDASYSTKGILQFDTNAATSGISITSGVASVVRTTTGAANTILALDGTGSTNLYGLGMLGSISGSVVLKSTANTSNYTLTLPSTQGGVNQVLQNDGSGNLLWASMLSAVSNSADLANGKIWVGNASGKATEVTLSGDATLSNTGALTLASTITAGGPVGTASSIPVITYDAKGRLTTVSTATVNDTTKLPLAGGTMSGAINMGGQDITNTGNIAMAANKYFTLSANSTNGTNAGQMWFDTGVIKYFDGSSVKSLTVAGSGITTLNGLSSVTQSFAIGTTGNSPAFSSASSTHTLNIPMASASGTVTAGLLSNSEYVTLSNKQSNALPDGSVWIGNSSGGAQARTLSGDATVTNAGLVTVDKTQTAVASKILQLDSSSVATTKGVNINGSTSGSISLRGQAAAGTYTLTLPTSAGSANQVLQTNGSGTLTWASMLSAVSNSADLANGKIWIGNASGKATEVAISGDATLSNTGALTLASTITAGGPVGTASSIPVITYDAKGRLTAVSSVTVNDTTKLPLTGGTMSGAINMGGQDITNTGNITMAANKYLTLSTNATNGTSAGQMWFDSGAIKYFDGSTVKTLDVSGSGITTLNGLSSTSQSFAIGTTGNSPAFISASNTHTLNIPMASASGTVTAGLLSNAEYVTLNNKQSNALPDGSVWIGNSSGGAQARLFSGDATVTNTGVVTVDKTQTAVASKILQLDASSVATTKGVNISGSTSGSISLRGQAAAGTYTLTLPTSAGSANQVLQTNGSGTLTWASMLSAVSNSADLANGKIWIGNASGKAAEFAVSGDATMSNTGLLTLASTITAGGPVGTASSIPVITYDAKGRLTAVTSTTVNDTTKLPLAGGTMSGAINMGGQDITNTGNISMAANKYFTLSANSTNGTSSGQMWFDSGAIKFFDGSSVKTLDVSGSGITTLNGLSSVSQSFAIGTTGNSPAFSSATNTHTLNIPMASASGTVSAGLLSNAEYAVLSAKQTNSLTSANIWIGNSTGGAQPRALSGDITLSYVGLVTVDKTTTGQSNKILALDGSGVGNMYGVGIKGTTSGTVTLQSTATTANYSLTFPAAQGAANQVLANDGSGNFSWISPLTGVSNSASLTNGKIWVGNASGKAAEVTMSGDATLSNTGALTLASTIAAGGPVGTSNLIPVITYDGKGRLTAVTSTTVNDTTKLPLAGGTMSGAINMGAQDITNTGNISMAANKYFTLSANSTNGTSSGQMWFDTGVIKYFDGSSVKSLTVAGSGITTLNGLSSVAQSFAIGTTGNAPAFSSATSTHTLNIPMASASGTVTAGLLSNAEYVTLANKQSNSLPDGSVWIGNSSGGAQARTMAGDATITNAGVVTVDKTQTAVASKILQLDSSSVATTKGVNINGSTSGSISLRGQAAAGTYTLTLPTSAGSANQVLQTNGSGTLTWASMLSAVSNSADLANGKIWVGNASSKAAEVTMSGDATLSNTGALTLASTITAGGPVGTASSIPVITYDAKGRLTAVSSVTVNDTTKLPLAGGTMSGAINMGGQDITNAGNISMAANKYFGLSNYAAGTGSAAGQMWFDGTNIKFFDGSSTKTLGIAGSGITNINGLTSGTQSFAVGSSGTDFNISSSGSTHTLNIPSASASNRGLLTTSDWTTFNSKQSSTLASTNIWVGNASGGAQARALSGDATVSNVGLVTVDKTITGQSSKILALDGSGIGNMYGVGIKGATSGTVTLQSTATTANYSLTFPAAQGAANQVLANDGSGNFSWISPLVGVSNSASLTNGKIWVGNASGKAAEVTMSGDATLSNTGALTLASTITAGGPVGTASSVPVITYDAKGRLTAVSTATVNDTTKLPLAGGTMSGAINMGGQDITNTGNITMAASKYFTLSTNSTNGSAAGQMWYDAGNIKYYDGSVVKTLGVAGSGITTLNGLSSVSQSFAVGTTGNSPAFSSAGNTHTLNIPMASTASVTAGLISKTDYDTFSTKQSNSLPDGSIWIGNSSGGAQARTIAGDATITNAGVLTVDKTQTAVASKILQLDSSSVATTKGVNINGSTSGSISLRGQAAAGTYTLTLPTSAGAANQVLQTNGSGTLTWASMLSAITNSADLTNGKIWVGNASGKATEVAISGDATLSNTGALTLASTITAGGPVGTASSIPVITYDAKGRLTAVSSATVNDTTKLPLAGGTMSGAINMGGQDITNTGNISMAANKYFTLSANSTNGTGTGQMWYDSGVIKYFDGSSVKSLGVAGSGITTLNGLSSVAQSFAIGTTGNAPAFSSASSTHTLNIPMASASGTVTAGLLSNAEYVALNNKQSNALASGNIWVGNASGGAQARVLSGDISSISNVGLVTATKTTTGLANTLVSTDGTGAIDAYGMGIKGTTSGTVDLLASATTANYALRFPAAAPGASQVLQSDASGNMSWINALTSSTGYINGGNSFAGNATIGLNDAYNLGIETANTVRMTVTSDGNIGVGTSTPTALLNPYISSSTYTQSMFRVQQGGSFSAMNDYLANFQTYGNRASLGNGTQHGLYVQAGWDTGTNETEIARFSALNGGYTDVPRMVIKSSGNVGIGTTTPSSKLEVAGQVAITANQDLVFKATIDDPGDIVWLNAGDTERARIHSSTGADKMLAFSVGNPNTTNMVVKESGYVGIGTTTPAYTLDVAGAIRAQGRIITTGDGVNNSLWLASGTSTEVFRTGFGMNADPVTGVVNSTDLRTGGFQRVFVNSAGNVGINTTNPSYTLHVVGSAGLSSGTAWTNASDARLKDIHGDYNHGLDEILQLHTVRYSYKRDNALGLPSDFEKTGFIAQEVQKVIPEAVNTRKDGFLELNVDPIHWAVVNAIKDLYQKYIQPFKEDIATLKAENAELKKENAEIKSRLEQQQKDIDLIKSELRRR